MDLISQFSEYSFSTLLALIALAFTAGFIDSIVGGRRVHSTSCIARKFS